MLRQAGRRLAAALPLLVIISLLVFVLLDLVPGDAATRVAGETATPDQIEATRDRLGLNDPLPIRYVRWLGDAVQGDLGESLSSGRAVTETIAARLPVTASIALVALVFTVLVALPLGLVAATRPNTLLDRFVTGAAALTMAMPPFVVGLVLVLTFAVNRDWFPATSYASVADAGYATWLRHLILPAVALACVSAAELARQTRGALIDALAQDYVRTARAKGLSGWSVVGKHAMKNAAIPIVTVFGLQIGRVVGGAVTVEFVFAMPGMGTLAYEAVNQRDIPMIQGIVLVTAIIVVLANLLIDLSYGILNPRVRR